MITFFPRNIGMWRHIFTFDEAAIGRINDRMGFSTMREFFEFLKSHGVRTDDPIYPLQLNATDHHVFGHVQSVVQGSLIGWVQFRYPINY